MTNLLVWWVALSLVNVHVARHFDAFDECESDGAAFLRAIVIGLAWPVFAALALLLLAFALFVGVPVACARRIGRWLRKPPSASRLSPESAR